ncbi:hypothetical protein [Flectobacillus sp. BAB-3569]|uniref:hypothetical protein n=1 Tax=Flectobacillus sp. BAB-3569 TaxID=1509483 RepID=UPI00114036B7|nr:hypothetical protein [Flectobacillus sp. BAB-3569]
MVLFLYVIPYILLWDVFKYNLLVSEKYINEFFFYILLCFGAFLLGDEVHNFSYRFRKSLLIQEESTEKLSSNKVEYYSIIIGIIGVIFYSYFIAVSGAEYFKGHGQGDYSIGGYIYELRYFVFSSILLLYNLYLRKSLSSIGKIWLLMFFIFLLFDAYVQQQRGSWIRFGIIFLFSNIFYGYDVGQKTKKFTTLFKENRKILFGGMFFLFILVFTVQSRNFYSSSANVVDVISGTLELMTKSPELLIAGSGIDHGNEFVVAYNAFYGMSESSGIDYGFKWLYPFLNFIPRALWKDKPTWETFSTNAHQYIDKYSVIVHAVGSAETGLVDTFYRFGWFSPIFFFFMGYSLSLLYRRASKTISSRSLYICLFVGFFYFLTQTMLPLIIFSIYMYLPIRLVLAGSKVKTFRLAK